MNKIAKAVKGLFSPMMLENDFSDYDEYWAGRGFHAPSIDRAKILNKHIAKGSSVIDVGCGDGTVLEYLKKKKAISKKSTGIDISESAVKHVKNKGFNALEYDVTASEFTKYIKHKKFDYIVITEVLEHIPEPEKVIKDVYNSFENALFVSVPNSGFFTHRLRLLFGRFPMVVIQQHVKEHLRFWTLKDFKYWADYQDLKVTNIEVTSGLGFKYLKFLENLFPSMFANQILYKLERK